MITLNWTKENMYLTYFKKRSSIGFTFYIVWSFYSRCVYFQQWQLYVYLVHTRIVSVETAHFSNCYFKQKSPLKTPEINSDCTSGRTLFSTPNPYLSCALPLLLCRSVVEILAYPSWCGKATSIASNIAHSCGRVGFFFAAPNKSFLGLAIAH